MGERRQAMSKRNGRSGAGPKVEGETETIILRYSEETSPVVECEINGTNMRLLVDTGSRVTLLKAVGLGKMKDKNLRPCPEHANKRFHGISGGQIDVRGCYRLKLALGRHRFEHPCFIISDDTALPLDGILGQDVLSEHNIDVLVSRGALSVRGDEVPFWRENKGAGGAAQRLFSGVPVRLSAPCVLPPLSEIICWVKVDVPEGELGVLEETSLHTHGVTAKGALVTVDQHSRVPVSLINFSREPLSLPRNKTVGRFHSAREAEVDSVRGVAESGSDQENVASLFELSHIQAEERGRLESLLNGYSAVFARSKLDLGRCDVIKHRINTTSDAPVYQRAYRIPYSQRDEMAKQIRDLEEEGIVEPSKSPWGAPALLVEKPDGSSRLVVDYRRLNAVTRVDPYPIPDIQETLAQLGSARYFSVVDLAAGFWQIEMDPRDKNKTAFNTPSGHYEWNRMPMGLVNSPAVWQRTADVILEGLIGQSCHVYMDDIVIYSRDFDSHLRDIERVLKRLRAAGLKLKPSKCQFLRSQVKYLGHIVSADGVRPDPEKEEAIRNFPRPTKVREIREFLGLVGYYRRFIDNFAKIAKPLTALTSKYATFRWGDSEEGAYCKLRDKLLTAPVLGYPDFGSPFILATDASQYALGAVLSQVKDGIERPIAFASRQLNKAEVNYSATEKECLAAIWATRHFRCYLYGRRFKIITDCRPLRWLMNVRDPGSRLARWNLQLQEYDYEIIHKPGSGHTNADALSRARDPPSTVGAVLNFVPVFEDGTIRDEQEKDPELRKISDRLAGNDSDDQGYFRDRMGLLRKGGTGQEEGRTRERTVIPKSLVEKVLYAYHNAPYSGHFGFKKTLRKITAKYVWRGMHRDVKSYCASCESCQLRKSGQRRRAPLELFGEVNEPFERTALDVVGPLPITTEGNKYVLVFVDHFTKFAEALPLRDQKAETVARAFVERIVLRHGVPQQLLTDQGTNFVSGLMKETCRLLGIKKLTTTAYHPESNGAVERLNKTIKGLLSHLVARDQRDWDLWMPYVLFSYNTAVHESTEETPFYLCHGRDPGLPHEILDAPSVPKYACLEDYRAELTLRMRAAHEVTGEALRKSQACRKTQYDRKTKSPEFREGDRVYVDVRYPGKGLSQKLGQKWKGPYRITRLVTPVVAQVKEIKRGSVTTVHVNRLKRAAPEGPCPTKDGSASLVQADATEPLAVPETSRIDENDAAVMWEAAEHWERRELPPDSAHSGQAAASTPPAQFTPSPSAVIEIDERVWGMSYAPPSSEGT